MRLFAVIVSTALLLGAGVAQAGFDVNMVDKKNADLTAGFDFNDFGVQFAQIEVSCSTISALAVMTGAQKNQIDSKKIKADQKTTKKDTLAPDLEIILPDTMYDGVLTGTTKAKMSVQATSKGKGSAQVDVDLGKAGVNMNPLPNADDAAAYADATKNKACQGVKTDKKFKKFKASLKGDVLLL